MYIHQETHILNVRSQIQVAIGLDSMRLSVGKSFHLNSIHRQE